MGPELIPYEVREKPYSPWQRMMETAMSPDAYRRSTPIVEREDGVFAYGYGRRSATLEAAERGRECRRSETLVALRQNPIDWC